MYSKTLALFALSASAVIASPFHKRADFLHHHRSHRTGTGAARPTGSGQPFPAGNDTDGFFAPTGTGSILPVTLTVSPLPASETDTEPNTFGNVAASSCTVTSIATETSTNLVTVTATAIAETKVVASTSSVATASANSVSAGAFYGGQGSRSRSASSAAQSTSAAVSAVASSARASTTFATVASSSKAGASSATSAAASASASAPPKGSSGGKRGISYNDVNLVSAFGSSVSWAYNWGSTESGNLPVQFVPMMWGRNEVSNFASKVGTATHVLSFNEPDLASQANIDPATAAKQHIAGMQSLKGKVQISSPAITNGDSQSPLMGIPWLNKWFEACAGACPVDFVAFHWYATADSFEYFKTHVEKVVAVAAANGISKVWLTEFAPEGSADAQAAFMKQAIPYLDSHPSVERYAGFMASSGTMLSGTSLNAVGAAYASS